VVHRVHQQTCNSSKSVANNNLKTDISPCRYKKMHHEPHAEFSHNNKNKLCHGHGMHSIEVQTHAGHSITFNNQYVFALCDLDL